MKIKVRCDCGKTLVASDKLAGKKTKCPACGAVIRLPLLDEASEQSASFLVTETSLNLTPDSQEACAAPAEETPTPFNFSSAEQTPLASSEYEPTHGVPDSDKTINEGRERASTANEIFNKKYAIPAWMILVAAVLCVAIGAWLGPRIGIQAPAVAVAPTLTTNEIESRPATQPSRPVFRAKVAEFEQALEPIGYRFGFERFDKDTGHFVKRGQLDLFSVQIIGDPAGVSHVGIEFAFDDEGAAERLTATYKKIVTVLEQDPEEVTRATNWFVAALKAKPAQLATTNGKTGSDIPTTVFEASFRSMKVRFLGGEFDSPFFHFSFAAHEL